MNITLNGDSLKLKANTSILTLLEIKAVKPERIVIEYNYNIFLFLNILVIIPNLKYSS